MGEVFRGNPADQEQKNKHLTRGDVERKIAAGEQLLSVDIQNLDLAGLPLMEKKFCLSDARGIKLHRRDVDTQAETITDISNSDWTDALLATENGETVFVAVQAQGARFGFTEQLIDYQTQNKQTQTSGKHTIVEAMNGLHKFNGARGNFQRTSWKNIDFGQAEFGAYFKQADFHGAIFDGCDLSGIDLSTCDLSGIMIKDPLELEGLKISENDMLSVAQGLAFSAEDKHNNLEERAYMYEDDLKAFLESYGIKVVA
jgi:uncharacterized protein YjbI with pentapeptide repeats